MSTSKYILVMLVSTVLLAGCATTAPKKNVAEQEALQKASLELPEEQLLDVWIEIFDPGELPTKEKASRGLSGEIRDAEARFMAVHLRGVMEKTGYWGAVRVVPENTEGAEVLVQGTILASDGEVLTLEITAQDASGREWFKRIYQASATADDYRDMQTGSDSFEPVYHAIANDLAEYRSGLTDEDRLKIRQIADMRFARDMLPDAFNGYVSKDEKGSYQLVKLPAEDDPAYQRVRIIRERDLLLIDTLNGHYDNFYRDLSFPYEEWRKARSIEAEALREVKKKANTRKALGVAAIVGAIAIEALGGSNTRVSTGTARDVMVIGGLYAIKSGMDINAQSTIHQEAIEELGISFSSETKPLVVEVEGEVHELTGSAEAQYEQWRDLMRKIYASETGLPPAHGGTGD
jgi:hypothetical protein